jgi:hypothetical protein
MKNVVNEEKAIPTITPPKTKLVGVSPALLYIINVIPKAPSPPKKAAKGRETVSKNPVKIEVSKISTAPKAAPDDTPLIYGSTRGFLTSACIMAPETARPAPIRIAVKVLGILE